MLCETVHAAFHIGVEEGSADRVNWRLVSYDIIFVDEVSQLNIKMVKHVLMTLESLPTNPVVVFVGDHCQLQPLRIVDGKTQLGSSIFDRADEMDKFTVFRLLQQLRSNASYNWKHRFPVLDKPHVQSGQRYRGESLV